MAVSITIRAGRAPDVEAMYGLDLLCFEPPYRFDLETMRHFATAAGAITLLAEQGAVLVGFVIVNVSRRRTLSSGYVSTLDVHPDHRRHGLASRLMAATEGVAVKGGVVDLRLHVSTGNYVAIHFYESLGYRRVLRTEDYYAEGLDAWLYVKNLVPRDK